MSASESTSRSTPPPQPFPDEASRPYWDHAASGELALPRCRDCGVWHETPIEFCRKCGGQLAYEVVSGRGEIYSYLVQHHTVAPGFGGLTPYVIALISPNEAPRLRLISRLVGIEPDKVRVGQKVKVTFVEHPGGDFKLPVFEPA